jgi:GxxExxY protein
VSLLRVEAGRDPVRPAGSASGSLQRISLECGYRMDVLLANQLVIEIKAVERVIPIHEAQMLSYLRLSGHKIGLLMNFHSVLLKDGIRRFVLS